MTLDSSLIEFNEFEETKQIANKSKLNDLDPTKLFFVGYQPKSNNNNYHNDDNKARHNNKSRSNDDDEEDEDELDELECDLLHENFSSSGGGSGGYNRSSMINTAVNKKMNISTRIENDIVRSEKKSEKRVNYQGRDDRATSEQVMDPRTRLMLFKLLSSGFLSEIDGK